MRIGLQDDAGFSRCAPGRSPFSIPIGLDDDLGCGCGCGIVGDGTGNGNGNGGVVDPTDPPDSGVPTATIRYRAKLYYDGDGTPTYEWAVLGSGSVVLLQERTELNDATGQTQVLANGEVSWADELGTPTETCVAWIGGVRYEVLSCVRLPGRLRLKLERLDDAE